MTDRTSTTPPASQPPESEAAQPSDSAPAGATKSTAKSGAVWMGTAVGIGSAALVAALMYAKRRK